MRIPRFITMLLVVWATLTHTATAAPIDADKARTAAQSFATKMGKQLIASTLPQRVKGTSTTHSPYYIYNTQGDAGFIIIAGDDRAGTLLGYTDRGHYNEAELPDPLRQLLADYSQQIQALDSADACTTQMQPAKVAAAHPSRTYVAPLLGTLWNQKDPYNALCPIYNKSDGTSSGTRSATGCVATALAQMMAYYKYPKATVADIPSYTFTSGGKSIKMDAIAKGTTIDWANITNTYSTTSTTAQKNAVANLMLMVGTGCEMVYGAASASNMQTGVQLLHSKMGYDETIRNVRRESYTQEEWTNMLYTEVAEGRPVGYRANSPSGGGHAFVIDGYDTADLFHVNWGWGGSGNGFFRISVLYQSEPTAVSTANTKGYSTLQEAIIGVKPNDGIDSGTDATQALTAHDITLSGNAVTITYTNYTGSAMNGFVGIGTLASDGTIESIGTSLAFLQNNFEETETFTISGLANGTQRIIPINRQLLASTWTPCCDTNHEYIEAVTTDGKTTLTLYPLNNAKLSVKEWSFVNNRVVNTLQHITTVISNSGTDFSGTLYAFASTSATDKGSVASYGGASIPAGKESNITFTFTPTTAGTYYIWITRDQAGTQVVGSTQVAITTTDALATNLSVAYVAYDNMVSNKVYGNYRNATITINNKGTADYNGQVAVTLYRGQIGASTLSAIATKYITINVKAGGQTRTVCRFDGLQTEYKYGLRLFYEGGKLALDNGNPNVIYSREQHAGIIFYNADGTTTAQLPTTTVDGGSAMAIDMRGVTGITAITPSTNPNALYLFDAGITVPSTLDGRNVVTALQANNIQLTDGYAFTTPVNFKAETVSYTRTLANSTLSENNWQSIALPFAPTAISCEGSAVSIDQSRIYLRRFAGQDATLKPIFESASTITANEPFIIKGGSTLQGKTITLSATNAQIITSPTLRAETNDYTFLGTTHNTTVEGSYTLNTNSNAFDYHAEATTVEPFRAYFVPTVPTATAQSIVIEGTVSAIKPVWTEGSTLSVYTLTGTKVGTTRIIGGKPDMNSYAPGIYIVGNRKVINNIQK